MKKYLSLFSLIAVIACSKSGGKSAEPVPVVSINGVSLPEGNTGASAFEFTLSLSNAISQAVTVTYSTLEGSAKAGEDFTAVTNHLCYHTLRCCLFY